MNDDPFNPSLSRRHWLGGAAGLFATGMLTTACGNAGTAQAQQVGQVGGETRAASARAVRLIAAARDQIGVTLTYDPAYTALDYPGGDVPRAKGVCTDVVIRAYRDALNVDLQKLVHQDMKAHFAAYPRNWGLTRPDRNIDHRRVPNLRTFFTRADAQLPLTQVVADWQPGDIFTSMIDGRLPHTGIVSDRGAADGTPLVIHNIGNGTREEPVLFAYPLTGHYRYELG